MFENRLLRRTFGFKGMELQEAEENCVMWSFIIFTLHKILLG
jgi:hypothetical protein